MILFDIILSPRARVLTLGSCKSESDAGQAEPGSENYIFFYSFTEIINLCFELLNLLRRAGVGFANHWDDVHLYICWCDHLFDDDYDEVQLGGCDDLFDDDDVHLQ